MGAKGGASNGGLEVRQTICCKSTDASSPQTRTQPDDTSCDACPHCADTCDRAVSCPSCQKKLNSVHNQRRGLEIGWLNTLAALSNVSDNERTITRCQLRRHNHINSAWILVGDTIYDATPYIQSHPGGVDIILKKSGGAADCTEDLRFHTKRARKEWTKFKVGKLTTCSCPRDHPR